MNTLKMGKIPLLPVPATPIRKTAYLNSYPKVVNDGILLKNHEYPCIFKYSDNNDTHLQKLLENSVATNARSVDARSAS